MAATVLVIDDDKVVRQQLAALLQEKGYKAIIASNQDDLLAHIETNSIDALICALNLLTDNQELLNQLRLYLPYAPVIVKAKQDTGSAEVLDALKQGVDDYFIYPWANSDVILHVLAKVLQLAKLEAENEVYQKYLEQTNSELNKRLTELRDDHIAGREIQIRLQPKPFDLQGLNFKHLVVPALFLSGDILDYFKISDHQVGFYIADVSGHGASSAFVTILIKKLVDQFRRAYIRNENTEILNPAEVLSFINTDLESSHLDKYATMFYAVIDTKNLTLKYSVGGHLPMPVLYSNDQATYLEGQGMAVGLFAEARFNTYECQLPEDFRLLLFSDGILEMMNDEKIDKERQLTALVERSQGRLSTLAQHLNLEQDVEVLDDITMVAIVRG